jgi:hypothetical protein
MQWSSWLIAFIDRIDELVQAVIVSVLALLAALGLG